MKRPLWLILLLTAVLVAGCTPPPTPLPTSPPIEGTQGVAPTNTEAAAATPMTPPTLMAEPTEFEVPEATAILEIADRIDALGAPSAEDLAAYEALITSARPDMDRVELATQLRGLNPDDIPAPPTEPQTTYALGDTQDFTIHLTDENRYIVVNMELHYISQYGYFWGPSNSTLTHPDGRAVNAGDWAAAGSSFDRSVEAVRDVFGLEPSPGIDGDPMLFVVVAENLGGAGGYYSPSDRLPKIVYEHSNEHEMFFVLSNTGVNSDYFNATLAHEFQHMVHDNADAGEEGWMDEGLAEVAQLIAGAPDFSWPPLFTSEPDQSLWYWSSSGGDYGHAQLIMNYLYERFGEEFITELVANEADGMRAVDTTLADMREDLTFEEVYADFGTALIVHNPAINGGIYGFENIDIDTVAIEAVMRDGAEREGEVSQFGFDMYELRAEGNSTLTFTGAQSAQFIPADPLSGTQMMWSTRTDSMYSTMTREIDLTGVSAATLNFWTWYNTEEHWDYAYVQVSADGGTTWTPLELGGSTDENPNNANYGNGLTGRSGGGLFDAVWIPERADLSAYAGQTILLRFAMFNDEALHEDNIAVDDVSIPEIGWSDDFEDGAEDWELDGFVRTSNRAPQNWIVRVVLIGSNGQVAVHDVEVVGGTGSVNLDFTGAQSAYVIVSGVTRFSNSLAPYRLALP